LADVGQGSKTLMFSLDSRAQHQKYETKIILGNAKTWVRTPGYKMKPEVVLLLLKLLVHAPGRRIFANLPVPKETLIQTPFPQPLIQQPNLLSSIVQVILILKSVDTMPLQIFWSDLDSNQFSAVMDLHVIYSPNCIAWPDQKPP
jgi:hypothetical protein